jgi:hypothetical protein
MARERDEKRGHRSAARQAVGGFCQALLGAWLTLGLFAVLVRIPALMAHGPSARLGTPILFGVVAPAIGIVATARLTSGVHLRGDGGRGRE